jgi:uncharacterized membrane protein YbhN (UPF0104 family)
MNDSDRPRDEPVHVDSGHEMFLRGVVSVTLCVLFIYLGIRFLLAHSAEVRSLHLKHSLSLGLLAVCFLTNIGLRGVVHLEILRCFDVRISLREALCLAFAASMMNHILPVRIGAGYSAAYLRQRYRLSLSLYLSTVAAFTVLFVMVATILALSCMPFIGIPVGSGAGGILLMLVAVLFGGVLLLFGPIGTLPGTSSFYVFCNRFLKGWNQIRRSWRLLGVALGVGLLSCLFGAVGFVLAFHAFGLELNVPGSVLLFSSQRIGGLVGITPGAVGFQELAGLHFARVLAISTTQALVVLATARIVRVFAALVTGLASMGVLAWGSRAR